MQQTTTCQHCRKDFTIEPEDFLFYEKMNVPAPTFCPTCRFVRRAMWMNTHSFYRATCDATGEPIISIYRPEANLTVYKQNYWWSDAWNGDEYAMDYDLERPFLEQLYELMQKTPYMERASSYTTLVNSEYVHHTAYSKNAYMITFADYIENSVYLNTVAHVNDSADGYRLTHCDLCYGSIGLHKCYRTHFSEECEDCRDVWFSQNCFGCSDCIGCKNLRKKHYCIFNEQLTKEEYEARKLEMNLDTHSGIKVVEQQAHEFWKTLPEKYMHTNPLSVNVTGDYVYESKNAHECYIVTGVEDSKFVQLITLPKTKDCYDYICWGANAERIYEAIVAGENSQNVKFAVQCWPNCSDVEYSLFAISCQDCFGCVNLKKKQYSILNKQYTKEEYFKLRDHIIEDMKKRPYVDAQGKQYFYGEFFPAEFSPFAYNETLAHDHLPLTQKEALEQGFIWYEKEASQHQATIQAVDLPNTIAEVDDTILSAIIACESTGRPYRIVATELELLRRMHIPLPRMHPDNRFENRLSRINAPIFHNRTTADGKDVLTAYAPDSPYEILSEEGYQDQVL